MSLLELFCHVDDCCQGFAAEWERTLLDSGAKRRRRVGELCTSEIVTILIHFHQSQYRTLKAY